MNKKIIRQALLFANEEESPSYSKVKDLCSLATQYQIENDVYFLEAKRSQKAFIKDKRLFFAFMRETQNINSTNFEELRQLLKSKSRVENILHSGDSKNSPIAVFDYVLVLKKRGEVAKLYKKNELDTLENIASILAIENGETFLNIDRYAKYFQEEYFVYLSGYANSLTREFLHTKDVTFFVDFDIEGMNIYESFSCKSKDLYIPKDIEKYFIDKKYNNVALYKHQRDRLRKSYSKEATKIITLIKMYNTVVEQEIIHEAP